MLPRAHCRDGSRPAVQLRPGRGVAHFSSGVCGPGSSAPRRHRHHLVSDLPAHPSPPGHAQATASAGFDPRPGFIHELDRESTLLADPVLLSRRQQIRLLASLRNDSDALGERELGWGQQLGVREIAAFGPDAEFSDRAVAAYVAKTPPSPPTPPAPSTAPCTTAPARDAAPPSCPTAPRSLHHVRRDRTGPPVAAPRCRPARAADDPHLLGTRQAAGVRRSEALEVGTHQDASLRAPHRPPRPLRPVSESPP
ncbi:hypothetical protein SUDANB150_01404 [Streptomyces sp. enrichment culture]